MASRSNTDVSGSEQSAPTPTASSSTAAARLGWTDLEMNRAYRSATAFASLARLLPVELRVEVARYVAVATFGRDDDGSMPAVSIEFFWGGVNLSTRAQSHLPKGWRNRSTASHQVRTTDVDTATADFEERWLPGVRRASRLRNMKKVVCVRVLQAIHPPKYMRKKKGRNKVRLVMSALNLALPEGAPIPFDASDRTVWDAVTALMTEELEWSVGKAVKPQHLAAVIEPAWQTATANGDQQD